VSHALLRGVTTHLPVLPIYLEVQSRKSPRNVFVCFVKICVIKTVLQGVTKFFSSHPAHFYSVFNKIQFSRCLLNLAGFIKDLGLNEFLRVFSTCIVRSR
jgi:hypothetical protein